MSQDVSPKTIYLKNYRPPSYLIDQVDLLFTLREQETRVHSRFRVRLNPAGEGGPLVLDGEGLRTFGVWVDGKELAPDAYQLTDTSLTLPNPDNRFILETEVELAPETNTALEGLYRSNGMFCTQCEAEGFRKITWFIDRPDVMAAFTVRIEADKTQYPVLLSNGNPMGAGDLPDGRHFAVWDDPFPKPCYLFALVAGDLDHVEGYHTTPSGRSVRLRIYTEAENIDRCDHALRSLQKAMTWDEEHYGRECDLDVYNIVAVNDFNMGAMENKGLNIFNAKFVLANPESATDADYLAVEGVIAHEYFHNWTGNRITCRDWFQLSLKEGFTVFRDQAFSADMGAREAKRIEDVRLLRSHQFAEDAGPMAHPVRPDSYMEINNFYTVTVYEKGAEVVRMQANLLGPELFRKATDRYFDRHDGHAVTTDDFVQCMADVSGRDLTQFKHWYDYAGTPELRVTSEYDEAAGRYSLRFRQQTPDSPGQTGKPPFHIPVAVGLLGKYGAGLLPEGTRMLELTEREQSFVFEGIGQRPVPSLLRGFSAPVKIKYDYSDEDLMFLMAKDSDGFNRWDAAQILAQRLILRMVADRRKGVGMSVDDGFIKAFRIALIDRSSAPSLLAEVLTLPSESYLGDQMAEVDVDGLFLARETLRERIGGVLREELLAVLDANLEEESYQFTPEGVGTRRLKNLALSYLMARGSRLALDLCLDQYGARSNMTDVMAALSLLADTNVSEREEALADFYDWWQDDPLVLDKWFAVQATSRREDTLQQVKRLTGHRAFSIKNPNKVRALIGAFCSGNPVRFHAADGSGYQFLADRVLELDRLNPQVAARMLRLMSRWRRYDEGRRGLMQGQLERVLRTDGLSKDVFEIASKSLEGA